MIETIRQLRWQVGVWVLALAAVAAVFDQPATATESRIAEKVQGGQENQATPYGFPVLVAGLDTNGKARVPKTDANGNLVVNTSGGTGTGAGQVQGTAADGAAAVGNPVQAGGVDANGNAQALLTDTSGRLLVAGAQADGATFAANPLVIAGQSGAGAINTLRTSSVDGQTAGAVLLAGGGAFNGSTMDRVRTANSASNTNGTGLLGIGLLGFDGMNYQAVKVDAAANPNLRVSLFNGANQVDTATAANDTVGTGTRGLAVTGFPLVYNGASWDRTRSPGLGTVATGSFRVANKSTPTVGTGTAYATGDVIGVKNTIANAVRISGGSGVIRSVSVTDKSGVADPAIALRVWYFDSDPSGSTFTDNAALTIVDGDITKCIGFIDLPGTGATAVNNEVWFNKASDLHFVASGSSSIYMVLEARGAVAGNAGTTDWQITTVIEQD